eukprot:CAMPEP_0202091250 /NCGR_PEP_ID=MMETSP0964-20121228/45533_1 /ASSEMBLY_ACC=CAM_ASM_000500 /TAXON_ID=4773 /ORGANISM="Schizochytrium aggregatum, Strain ATCC28209" /LENGTH=489 /DNA_ID=CAMNT_0048659429 /DNA_START=48 /DNA_END=1517 /DNA_ORIENTATION=+
MSASTGLGSKAFGMVIGGAQVRSAQRLFDVLNPFDGKVFAQAPEGGREELDAAVKAAREALPAWAARSWEDRQQALRQCAGVLIKNKDSLAQLLTLEQGKGLPQAMAEVKGSYAWLDLAARSPCPNSVLREDDKVRIEKHYRPIGVVGAIVAWNFPLLLIHFKIAQALLAGCTVILKPSEHTPLCALEVARLYNEVLPPGVLNVICSSDKDLGRHLVEHPGVDKISFTGSTATGKHVLSGAAKTLKRVTVELGGNDPAIVMPDVDPAKVAPYLFRGALGNSGQVCMAIKRIFCHESIYDELCAELANVAAGTKFGNGMDKDVVYGPVNNQMQYDKVRELLADAVEQGAEVLCGGIPPASKPGQGFLFPPVVLKNVKEGVRIVDEEQFGPVVPVIPYKTTEEAIQRANATTYGLGASVWSGDVDTAADVAAKLVAGTTWVNDHGNIIDGAPFGGAKESGIGHEGGEEGLLAFMQLQVVKVKKGQAKFSRL